MEPKSIYFFFKLLPNAGKPARLKPPVCSDRTVVGARSSLDRPSACHKCRSKFPEFCALKLGHCTDSMTMQRSTFPVNSCTTLCLNVGQAAIRQHSAAAKSCSEPGQLAGSVEDGHLKSSSADCMNASYAASG